MEEKRLGWVALNLIFAGNRGMAGKIAARFPHLPEAFRAPASELTLLGIEKEKAALLASPRILRAAAKEIARSEKKKYSLLTIDDEGYPQCLREIFDPPFVLYCAGNLDVLDEPTVAVVGARKPTPYGRAVAERLAEDLASRGIVVVSGLARGIDSTAHWGALKGGKTVAVLGSGLENIYPGENRRLFEKIMVKGAVVSEFPLDSEPLSFHFPIRNRIISGLSRAIVVVEATRRSGSLISARLALEQGREVMAVPGNITSELSRGTNWLIKEGAKPIESWEDVVEEFPPPLREELLSRGRSEESSASMRPETPEEKKIFDCLRPDTLTHIDEIIGKTGFSVSETLVGLLALEIRGLISQSPGKYFQRRW